MLLMQKLQIVQQKLKAPKGQYNEWGKYKYRSLEDITEAVKPLLAEVDALITIKDDIVLIGDRYYVQATAVFADDSGKVECPAFAREPLTKKGMDESQITGAASSYARKYAMNGLLVIDDTRDADTMKPTNGQGVKPKAVTGKVSMKIIDQAFFNFQTENTDRIARGFCFSKDKFIKAIYAHFKRLPTDTSDEAKSIRKICDTIKPEEVLEEVKEDNASEADKTLPAEN